MQPVIEQLGLHALSSWYAAQVYQAPGGTVLGGRRESLHPSTHVCIHIANMIRIHAAYIVFFFGETGSFINYLLFDHYDVDHYYDVNATLPKPGVKIIGPTDRYIEGYCKHFEWNSIHSAPRVNP